MSPEDGSYSSAINVSDKALFREPPVRVIPAENRTTGNYSPVTFDYDSSDTEEVEGGADTGADLIYEPEPKSENEDGFRSSRGKNKPAYSWGYETTRPTYISAARAKEASIKRSWFAANAGYEAGQHKNLNWQKPEMITEKAHASYGKRSRTAPRLPGPSTEECMKADVIGKIMKKMTDTLCPISGTQRHRFRKECPPAPSWIKPKVPEGFTNPPTRSTVCESMDLKHRPSCQTESPQKTLDSLTSQISTEALEQLTLSEVQPVLKKLKHKVTHLSQVSLGSGMNGTQTHEYKCPTCRTRDCYYVQLESLVEHGYMEILVRCGNCARTWIKKMQSSSC